MDDAGRRPGGVVRRPRGQYLVAHAVPLARLVPGPHRECRTPLAALAPMIPAEGCPHDRPTFLGGVRLPRPARAGALLFGAAGPAGHPGRRRLDRYRRRTGPHELPARTGSPAATLA